MQRQFWAMSKRTIKQQNTNLPMKYFGTIDSALYQSYSCAQFFSGTLGDAYSKRVVLSISFVIQGVVFTFIGWGGDWFRDDMADALWYFSLCFILVGVTQSVDFPCLISTIGSWTERRTRGMISGFWATCSQVGNIIGIQSAAYLLSINGHRWQTLTFIVTVIYIVSAIAIYLIFV